MVTTNSPDNYFSDARRNRLDITDSYLALGDIPDLVGVSVENEDQIIQGIRRLLIEKGGGLARISDLAEGSHGEARALYHGDKIVAVDGTDAISPLRFVSDTIYAVGVIAVTPRSHHEPRALVTRTRASSFVSHQDLSQTWEESILSWGEYLRGAREHEMSWVNTFREYEERGFVDEWLQADPERIALIDGPILTQNLLSQMTSRGLLENLIVSKRTIGFIKNLSANPLLVAIGCALRSGEAYVLSQWSNLLSDRFRNGQGAISSWIEAEAGDVVRAVYKVNRKAYCVECLKAQLPLAFAILEHDPGGSADHDIPMLLQIADAHVRSQFNGASAREQAFARYSLRDPDRFLELTNERSLR